MGLVYAVREGSPCDRNEPLAAHVGSVMRQSGFVLILSVFLIFPGGDARAGLEQGKQAFHQADFARAVAELREPAEAGDPEAQYLLGRILLTRPDMEGVRWIRTSAEAHHLPAEMHMGLRTLLGVFEPVDVVKSMVWLKRAVGHPPGELAAHRYAAASAQYLLAHLLLSASASDADREEGVRLMRLAAEAGLDEAQAIYSQILGYGVGVPIDVVEAQKHYLLFVKQEGSGEAFRLGVVSFEERLSDEEKAEVEARVDGWLEARDAGSLGWVYERNARLTEGQKKLEVWGDTGWCIFRYLAREAGDRSCPEGAQWLREIARVETWTPGASAWLERWTFDTCGTQREFVVQIRPHERGLHWTVQGPAGQGAPSPEDLLEQTLASVMHGDFETLPKLVAPDERPYLNEFLLSVPLTLRGHCLMDFHGNGVPQQQQDLAAMYLKTVETALGRYGLSLETFESTPVPVTLGDAPAIAAWWEEVAPGLDHTAFLIDLLYDLAPYGRRSAMALARPTRVFEPYCGETTALEVEGDGAIAVIRNLEVPMRRIAGRWYLSVAGGPQPARYRPPGSGVGAAATVPANESALEKGEAAYERGDFEAARAAWAPPADRGGREAQLRLAALYEHGEGVEADLVTAHMWYTLANARKSDPARACMLALQERMTPAQREVSDKLVAAWGERTRRRHESSSQYPLFPVIEKGKWGFIDLYGRLVIPTRYDTLTLHRYHPGLLGSVDFEIQGGEALKNQAWPTTDELIPVELDGKWGYAGRDGLGIEPRYDDTLRFSEGLGIVRTGSTWTVVDRHGAVAIPGCTAARYWFEVGAAAIRVDGRWGLIDRDGKVLIEPTYDAIAPGSLGLKTPGLWELTLGEKLGIARSDGRVLVEPRFDALGRVGEGLVAVRTGTGWGYVDLETGQLAIEPRFGGDRFEGGIVPVRSDDGYVVLDREGRVVYGPVQAHYMSRFHGTLMTIMQDEGSYIVDARTGEVVSEKQHAISPISDGRAQFSNRDGWVGYLDVHGRVAIAPRFSSGDSFSGGLAAAAVDSGPYGYLDPSGTWVIKPRFEQAAPFRGGLALVVEDGGKSYSYVNRDGQTVYSFPRVRMD